jgi:thiol-disulfide isomerase/thioredoxin
MSGGTVVDIKTMLCCAIGYASLWGTPAIAEVTGQERAVAAGRAILGSPAPRLVLKTIDGDTIDLGGLYGKKAVYLKFWATWCVPCRQQMPHFEHVYQTAGADLAVIAIDVGFNDSVEAVQAYRRKLGISMPIVFDDGSLDSAFNLRVTPTHIIIGRDGRIRYVGHLADGKLDAELAAARTAAPVPAAGAVSGAAAARVDPAPISVGDRLPNKALRTLDGQRFELLHDAAPREMTVLVFLSPWCESYLATTRPEVATNCRRAREQIGELAGDPRLRVVGIASGLWANSEDLRKYRGEYKVSIPLTLDASGTAFREFRVVEVPTVVIADAGGRVVRRIEGAAAGDRAALRAAIDGS